MKAIKTTLRKIFMAATIAAMMLGMSLVSFAGEWQWIDTDENGIAECYYINDDGTILTDTVTPDGYTVNELGQWVSGGTVMLKAMGGINENFDTYARLAEEYGGSTGTDISISTSARITNENIAGDYYVIYMKDSSNGIVSKEEYCEPHESGKRTVIVLDENTIEIKDSLLDQIYTKDENGNYVYHNSGASQERIATFYDDGTLVTDLHSWFGERHTINVYSKNVIPVS